jgi:uncharacterized YigZ family protein
MINYKTVIETSEAFYEISRSRFITHVSHVETEEAAREFIHAMKKKYFDARHNCSAYIIGDSSNLQKSSDDGEPGGTAGNPILEVIKKNALSDIVLVVTRYFGGIKLGAGGLIRAYGHSAVLGINAAAIVEKTLFRRIAVTVDYTLSNTVENLLRIHKIIVENKVYSDKVCLTLLLRNEKADNFLTILIDLTAARCHFEKLGETYVDIPIIVK